jgi:DNA-binding NtrC family response regulator
MENNHGGDPTELVLGDLRMQFVDPTMICVMTELARMARSRLPILIHGETGVGKELVARAAHHLSQRADRPFVAINCAAVPRMLMSSTLFGHEKGAFTSAATSHVGLFENANGGTLFLDEIGELDEETQAILLRALADHRVRPLGSETERRIDVRCVAATNRDLGAAVTTGRFREDLFHRLGGAMLEIPPLRARPLDIPLLARTLLRDACLEIGRPELALSEVALMLLRSYTWPGNVRELAYAMVYAANVASGDLVEASDLPAHVARRPRSLARLPAPAMDPARPPRTFVPIDDEVNALVGLRMRQALEETGGNQRAAAELLHMPRRTFITRMREYGIEARRERGSRALRKGGIQ